MKDIYGISIAPTLIAIVVSAAANANPAEPATPQQSPALVSDQGKVEQTGERGTRAALSTVLRKGIDEKGLTMQEKWDDDIIVCKRTHVSGSRFRLKVCHSRAEWQAMRSNGRETVDSFVRGGLLSGSYKQ